MTEEPETETEDIGPQLVVVGYKYDDINYAHDVFGAFKNKESAQKMVEFVETMGYAMVRIELRWVNGEGRPKLLTDKQRRIIGEKMVLKIANEE